MVDPSDKAAELFSVLRNKLQDPGFTPGRKDGALLLEALGTFSEADAALAQRALIRVGEPLTVWVSARFLEDGRWSHNPANSKLRADESTNELGAARMLRTLGRASRSEASTRIACAALQSASIRIRKEAATQLGKLHAVHANLGVEVEQALLAELAATESNLERDETGLRSAYQRTLVEALGKVGREATQQHFAKLNKDPSSSQPADQGKLTRAQLQVERTVARQQDNGLRAFRDHEFTQQLLMQFNCRRGLESLVASQLAEVGFATKQVGSGFVTTAGGPQIGKVLRARCFLDFGFVIALPAHDDIVRTVAEALAGDTAAYILKRFGSAKPRVRIAFDGVGHQRKLQWELAAALRAGASGIISDPTESEWEVRVQFRPGAAQMLLVPRLLEDTRFKRIADVPAASHPTLAAALVALAGHRPADVIWDPFVGSGTELLERAGVGPYQRMFGTDIDEGALNAARANLDKLANIELRKENCLQFRPGHLTTIVTNPPLGRRVLREDGLPAMLDGLLTHGTRLLTKGGRFVWFTPRGAASRRLAATLDMQLERSFEVDMGGFMTDLQVFEKVR